ncbi:DNA polymerase III subunit gamma/tau [Hordeum vulgare]|nr:DNA polymerase III subunit gamma/tau [Hordeum vulgare]
MVVGLLASKDGVRLAGARVGQHGVGPLSVVPGPGGGLMGDAEEMLSWIQRPSILFLLQKKLENLRKVELVSSTSGYRGGGSDAVAEAPTVQLMFSSRVNKSKDEKSRGQILQAFESVLSSAIILEIRYESNYGGEGVEDTYSNIALTRSFTKHSSVSSGGENLVSRLQKGRVASGTSSNQTRWMQSDPHILTAGEIIEVGHFEMEWYGEQMMLPHIKEEVCGKQPCHHKTKEI